MGLALGAFPLLACLPGGGADQLSFVPSNVDLDGVEVPSSPLELGGDCEIETDQGTISCADTESYVYRALQQDDADKTPVGLFVAGPVTIENAAQVSVVGNRPLALVSFGELRVHGLLRAVPEDFQDGAANGGGFSSPSGGRQAGLGPGGGAAGSDGVGAGGAGHCGAGGGAGGGQPYGSAAVTPLVGGSSGGAGEVGESGAGGGAIQLIARDAIDVTTTGVVHVGAAGGNFGGSPAGQPGAGGGSGGSLLLEAPKVRIAGALAANGGGGGGAAVSGERGGRASADAVAAPGGSPNGGDGAAGAQVGGSTGTEHGGGGGGAGWIRINTEGGAATIEGTLSPDPATACVSQGTVEMK